MFKSKISSFITSPSTFFVLVMSALFQAAVALNAILPKPKRAAAVKAFSTLVSVVVVLSPSLFVVVEIKPSSCPTNEVPI